MIEEIFKDIEGYEGLYKISNQGRVLSLGNGNSYNSNNSKERILKPAKDKDGYLRVSLFKQGKRKLYLIHRLVAQAFLSNLDNLEQVNHKNEIKTDNRVENLEFCDALYNNNFGSHNQRVAESNKNHPNKSKKVLCVETGKTYLSAHQVQREFGFDFSNISKCCTGRLKTCGGYTWRYVQ